MAAKTFAEIAKFNPYHDERGRFATANSATSFTIRTKDPDKQFLADRAREREKERDASAAASSGSEEETPQMKAIHEIEDKIRNQDYESAAVVDAEGEVLFFKDGEQSQVSFTWMEGRMMWDNILTHNHPSSSMFSGEDIACFLNNHMQGIRATNRQGITYFIQRGEDFRPSSAQKFLDAYKRNKNEAIISAQRNMDDRGFQRKIAHGEVTRDEANVEFRKLITQQEVDFCTKNAAKYGLDFSVEKRDVSKSAGTTVYTVKAADDSEIAFTLDKETEDLIETAFNEWLNKEQPAKKSMEDSRAVLFIGLKISGADSLAIEGGEKPDDFHVTLAYGHFDTHGHDEDDISCRVQFAIDQVIVGIPDKIRFDAIGRFPASKSSDGKDVIYAQVAAGQLEEAHDFLLSMLKEKGIKLEQTFTEYKPHMTLAYIESDEEYELGEIDATGTVTEAMIGHGWESSHENERTIAKTFNEILGIEKFNPYHDRLGRFTSAGSETSFTYAPGKSNAHDKAIERHKERMAAAAPTEAQEKTLKGIESRTRNLKKEQFRVVDREGNVVMQKQGDQHSVSYSVGEARDNFPGNITIHNHPDGGTFSSADLSDIGYGATEIRAAAPEGTYILRNLSHGTKWTADQKGWYEMRDDIDAASQSFKNPRQLKKELRGPYEQQVKPLADKWAKRRDEGASQEELNAIAKEYTEKWDALKPQLEQAARQAYVDQYHHWYNANAGKYGFEYSFTPAQKKTRKSDTMEEFGDIEKGSGEIVLDRKMNEDVQEIVDDVLSEYPRDLNQVDTRKSISIFKTDDDKRLVFGWASISITVEGEQLEDRQHDLIDPEDLEEAAYEYVLNFRDTGEEHIKSLRKKGKLVESCVFTAEKQKAMGIPEGTIPVGWWIGFKIEDDDAWEKVKNGTYKMFSIEGRANRVPVEKAEPVVPERVIDKSDPDRFIRIEEFP